MEKLGNGRGEHREGTVIGRRGKVVEIMIRFSDGTCGLPEVHSDRFSTPARPTLLR